MSWFSSHTFSKNSESIVAQIQVTGSVGLAAYTYGKRTYGILPFVCSAIAAGGTYNFFKAIRNSNQRSPRFETDRVWSSWDLASGALTYSSGVYAFSEALKRNDKIWIFCLAVAATGHYFSTFTVNTWNRLLYVKPYLKCYQLMFEPALIAFAGIYLFYFRKHDEGWLKCLVFLLIAATGLKNVHVGTLRDTSRNDTGLIQGIEMSMGGCLFSVGCALLAVHGVANQFDWPWTPCTISLTIYGAFITFCSLRNFQEYFEMEEPVFESICLVAGGPILFLMACIGVGCISDPVSANPLMVPAFCFAAGISLSLCLYFARKLNGLVPSPVCSIYIQRILGPTVTVYSSLAAAYFGYRTDWRFPLMMTPFIFSGINITINAFRRWY